MTSPVLEPLVSDLPESELASVLDALPAALLAVVEEDGGVLAATGHTVGLDVPATRALATVRIAELVHPPHVAEALALLAQETPVAAPQSIRLQLVGADGPAEVLASCRRVPDGPLTDVPLLAFARAPDDVYDETELRNREHLLGEAERVAHLGSWAWDIVEDAVTWSDELYRMYGYEPGEIDVTLATVLEHTIDEDRDYTRSVVEHGLRTQLPFTYSHRIRQPAGDVRVLHSRGRVTEVDDQGHPLYMVGVCQDVTSEQDLREQGRQFRELYEREREVAERLREVDELKDALVAAVSHDLRTPLAVIVGSAGTLRDLGPQLDDETARVLLDNTIDHANRLHAMLSDLLDLDRLRRGRLRPQLRPTPLCDLVRGTVAAGGYDTSRVEFVERQAELVADVDAPKVERIVENLVRNALRYTAPDGRVWVRVERDDDRVVLTVEDDGPGVPVEVREQIFEPFERADVQEETQSGSGLGLAIVQRFARLHDGVAWVDERPGGGAAFHVRLPIRHD